LITNLFAKKEEGSYPSHQPEKHFLQKAPRKMIYLQYLSLSSMAWIARLMFISGEVAGSPKVYYIDGSKFTVTIASILLKLKGIEFEQLSFELMSIRDAKGELIRIRIPRKDLYAVEQVITQSKEFKAVLNEQQDCGRLSQYVIKRILGEGILDPASISRVLYIINVVSDHAETVYVDSPILIIPGHAWYRFLEGYAKGIGVTLVFSRSGFGDLTERLSATIRRLPRVFAALKMLEEARRAGLSFRAENRPQTSARTKCYVEAKGVPNLDDNGQFSDFFWQISSTFDRSRIVYTTQNRADVDRLRRNGINSAHSRRHIPKAVGRRVTLRTKLVFKKERVFIKNAMAEYRAEFCYWNSLFQDENIKIHLGWYKYNAKHMAIADAIRQAGGIAAAYQFGLDGFRNYECKLNTDVVFGYSNFSAEIEKNNGSSISHFVVTGFLRNYNQENLVRRAGEVREKLNEAGAQKIVCVLDENSANDKRWHTGHELQKENYSVMLEEVMRRPWLGVIFKPKVPGTLRSRLGPVNDLLTAAEKTGRCVILEASEVEYASSTPVLLAGLASDVVVHGHLCAGTAALECMLKGIPTLLIDREGAPMSKLYELPSGKVRFANWAEAVESLMAHFMAKNGISNFGIWDETFLREMDPFRDDKAAARMGSYLQWLIDGFDRGQDRGEILGEAANRYRESWGEDKVIQIGDCH